MRKEARRPKATPKSEICTAMMIIMVIIAIMIIMIIKAIKANHKSEIFLTVVKRER